MWDSRFSWQCLTITILQDVMACTWKLHTVSIRSHGTTSKNSATFSEQQICNSEAVRSISIPCSQTYGITTEERHFAALTGFSWLPVFLHIRTATCSLVWLVFWKMNIRYKIDNQFHVAEFFWWGWQSLSLSRYPNFYYNWDSLSCTQDLILHYNLCNSKQTKIMFYLNILLPSTSRFPKWFGNFRFAD